MPPTIRQIDIDLLKRPKMPICLTEVDEVNLNTHTTGLDQKSLFFLEET